jgi:hypothetical protein
MSRQRGGPEEVERLRAIGAERVRKADLRALAAIDEDGSLSFGRRWTSAQLKSFLDGWEDAPPHERASRGSAPERSHQRGDEMAALGALVRDLSAERRRGAIVSLLNAIAAIYDRLEVSLPAWFTDATLMTCSNEVGEWNAP